jgi:hypothetical protein
MARHARKPVGEAHHQRGQGLDPKDRHGDQVDPSAAQTLRGLHGVASRLEIPDHLSGRFDQTRPGFREHDTTADPVEQGYPELALETRDGRRQRWLGHVEVRRCPAETTVVHDGQEVAKLPRVHTAP